MNTSELKSILDKTGGKVFKVRFVKADGSIRVMHCRTGVKKHLKGGESTIAHKPELYSVYDMDKHGYRCFNLNKVLEVQCGEVTYKTQ